MKFFTAWVVLLGLVWGHAAGSQDAVDWLRKIDNAVRTMNYSGVLVYVDGDRIETMRVVHRVEAEGSVRQRIYALNGAPREIVRDFERIRFYAPDRKIGVSESQWASRRKLLNPLPGELEALLQFYRVIVGPVTRVADRAAQQIRILPKDDWRYGYKLWADQQTGLLLRTTLVNSKRRPIEQYLFTEISIGNDITDGALEPVTPREGLVWHDDARSRRTAASGTGDMPRANWTVRELPDGFVLDRMIRRFSSTHSGMVEHYVYSDGLATVSVFVQPIKGKSEPRLTGLHEMGAAHAFGRQFDGYQITAIGDVPARTVDTIAMSVQPR